MVEIPTSYGPIQTCLAAVTGSKLIQDPFPGLLIPLKRFLSKLTAAALLLATALPGSAWAGAAFNKTLELQGISFQVQSSGEGSQQQLTITTTGAKPPIKLIRQTVNGKVVGAEVADLNANGQ